MCDFGEIEREKKCVYVCVNEKERLLIVAERWTCEDKDMREKNTVVSCDMLQASAAMPPGHRLSRRCSVTQNDPSQPQSISLFRQNSSFQFSMFGFRIPGFRGRGDLAESHLAQAYRTDFQGRSNLSSSTWSLTARGFLWVEAADDADDADDADRKMWRGSTDPNRNRFSCSSFSSPCTPK